MNWSGRLDLNQRPPEPHSGALPGCATPRPKQILPQALQSPQALAPERVSQPVQTYGVGVDDGIDADKSPQAGLPGRGN